MKRLAHLAKIALALGVVLIGLAWPAGIAYGLANSARGNLEVTVARAAAPQIPFSLILYDDAWQVVAEVTTSGTTHTFQNLASGVYGLLAYSQEGEAGLVRQVRVAASRTTRLTVPMTNTLANAAPGLGAAKSTDEVVKYPCSWGDGNLIKVGTPLLRTIIYMRCGREVYRIEPACGCRGGNWRYTTTCPKGPPIYVHLPCR